MNKIPSSVYSYLSSIQRIQFFPNYYLIKTGDGIYYYSSTSYDKETYDYLKKIQFFDYYYPINKEDEFQLFRLDSDHKLDSLTLLRNLYSKSFQMIEIDSSFKNKIYQKLFLVGNQTLQFYYGLQDQIEEMYYPRKNYYQLILHISKIYKMIYLGHFFLQKYLSIEINSTREVLTVGRIYSNNFIGGKIIDFSSSKRDIFIFELANYYREHFKEESILFEIEDFQNKFSMTEFENTLFYALISIPWILEDEEEIDLLLHYVEKTSSFLLEKYKEYEE